MVCYREGGCGPYEKYGKCEDCPASKPDYLKTHKSIPKLSLDQRIISKIMTILSQKIDGFPSGVDEDGDPVSILDLNERLDNYLKNC